MKHTQETQYKNLDFCEICNEIGNLKEVQRNGEDVKKMCKECLKHIEY